MCGSYELKASAKDLARHFPGLHLRRSEIPCQEEMHPTDRVLMLTGNGPGIFGHAARWGLVGSFLEITPRTPLTKLRSEGLAATPFYNRLLKGKRCLVPATAFFESKPGADRTQQKTRISHPVGKLLFFAGVFDQHPAAGTTCAILTMPAHGPVGAACERMPLILGRDDAAFWLDEHPEFPADKFAALAESPPRMDLKLETVEEPPPSPQLSFEFA
jgi:putative SOS response-associated peptidase YedK